ncbi:MAG: hypothetical protein WBF34_29215, partial [Streptosporangiaceae bacterium]
MADLPAKPSLDHLRRQARDLLRAAQADDTTAAGRIRAVADALTWPARSWRWPASTASPAGPGSGTRSPPTPSLARQAEAFCEAS